MSPSWPRREGLGISFGDHGIASPPRTGFAKESGEVQGEQIDPLVDRNPVQGRGPRKHNRDGDLRWIRALSIDGYDPSCQSFAVIQCWV